MARYLFGDLIGDWSMLPPASSPGVLDGSGGTVAGIVIANANGTGQVSLTEGGEIITNLTDASDNPVTAIATDNNGFLVPFKGPDEVSVLFATFDGGSSWVTLISREILIRAAAYRSPVVVIAASETSPPIGTPAGTLIFRRVV